MWQRTEPALKDLENTAALLDNSIETELRSSPTQDPLHFAFPMTARALVARGTIAALSEDLGRGNYLERAVA
jgi:hypothetical protein